MKYQEFAVQFRQLPIDQQLLLIEELTRTLRMELAPESGREKYGTPLLWRGMLKTDVPPPTDEEIEEAYTDYLIEKY
ncbi:MAG: hypothetical protein WHX53_08180 [Anaerolineae bacterium]